MARPPKSLRFDVEKAIDTLHAAALEAGAVPEWDRAPPGARPSAVRTALSHMHGVEHGACRAEPCRLGGFCHALWELFQYQAEVANQPIRTAIQQSVRFRRSVERAADAYVPTLTALEELAAQIAARGTALTAVDNELFSVQPVRIVRTLVVLTTRLRALESALRQRSPEPWSTELHETSRTKRRDALLAAVQAHLRLTGGLPYKEIASLIPDGYGGTEKQAAERVATRIRANTRWMPSKPNRHAEGAFEARSVFAAKDEKRKRR